MQRLLRSFITLLIVVSLVFLLLRLMPEEGYFGTGSDKLDEAQKEATLTKLGLRDPWYSQLGNFYKNLTKGDFGKSISYRKNYAVSKLLIEKVPYSIKLGLIALSISLVFGISLGIVMARSKGKWPDKLGTLYIVIINAVPAAVYYLVIQLV